ncbi:putative sexual development protein [Halenospora varia]|nr:putative sexual development protein [Halenospora varia]
MRSSLASVSLIGLSYYSTIISAAPFSFNGNPLQNNFPNPNPTQLLAIETQAHGSLPIAPASTAPAAPLHADTITSLQLVAFNELFEVAFFTSLIQNITNNVPGYEIQDGAKKKFLLANLMAIQAQEELHALNANMGLQGNHADPIQPCQYTFPVDNLSDAIGLASKFTDVVLGTLQDVQQGAAVAGDTGLVPAIGSVIGQEGEQNGFFRLFNKKIPSALPFLTRSTRDFAFSALNQNFVVPNSCPNINIIKLKIFQPLAVDASSVMANPTAQSKVSFSFSLPQGGPKAEWKSDYSGLEIVYINQQNAPITAKLESVAIKGNMVTFEALFPFNAATFGNGLTIAALVTAGAPIANADQVAAAAVAGPGLIEIN